MISVSLLGILIGEKTMIILALIQHSPGQHPEFQTMEDFVFTLEREWIKLNVIQTVWDALSGNVIKIWVQWWDVMCWNEGRWLERNVPVWLLSSTSTLWLARVRYDKMRGWLSSLSDHHLLSANLCSAYLQNVECPDISWYRSSDYPEVKWFLARVSPSTNIPGVR